MIANILTASRILFSVVILFLPTFSTPFSCLYLAAGISDMLDGPIARYTHTESEFGAKLDSIADMVFVAACMIKILPKIHLNVWLWIGIIIVVVIRAIELVFIIKSRKGFVYEHTTLNRIMGVLLFIFPMTIKIIDVRISGAVLIIFALIASLEGFSLSRKDRECQ